MVDTSIARARKYKPERADEVSRRLENLFRPASALSTPTRRRGNRTLHSAATAADISDARASMNAAMRVENIMPASPGSVRSLGYALAQNFALVNRGFGLLDTMTDEGAIRTILRKARKRGEGTVHHILQNLAYIDASLQADQQLEAIRRRLGIDKDKWHRLKLDMTEVGMHPYVQKDLNMVGPAAIEFLRGRQKRMFNYIAELGIPQQDADQIAAIVGNVTAQQRATLEIAKTLGVNLDDIGDGFISYIPRVFNNEAVRRFGWYRKDDVNLRTVINSDGSTSTVPLPTRFTKERTTEWITVEDEMVLDAVLTGRFGPGIYKELGVESVDDLILNNRAMAVGFSDVIDRRSPALFDALVEANVVNRIPMTGTEIFDYAIQRYELPFKNLSEFLPYRFEDMTVAYRSQLERLAGRSFMAHLTAKEAIENGWGITEAQRLAEPDKYRRWTKLTSNSVTDTDVVISAEEARTFGINTEAAGNTYVHPVVASMYRSQLEVFTDPAQLGSIARFFHQLNTTFTSLVLASSGFVFRQLYTPIFQIHAGGGRLDRYFTDMGRSLYRIADLRRQGLSMDKFFEMYDDTKAIYRGFDGELITERQLWKELRERGEVTEIIPWLGTNLSSRAYQPRSIDAVNSRWSSSVVESVKRQARYTQDIFQNFDRLGYSGVAENLIYQYGEAGERVGDGLFHWFSASNVLFDNVARFSLAKSLTDTTRLNSMMRVAHGNIQSTMNLGDAIKRIGEYFFDYSDRANFDQFMGNIRPFWMFTSRNTFAVWRMMVRHPGKFMAYQRLYAMMNRPDDQEEIPRGGIQDWIDPTTTSFWITERNEQGTPTSVIAMPRAQFDPIAEGTRELTSITDSILRSNGIWPTSTWSTQDIGSMYDDLPWDDTLTNRFLREQLEQSFGAWKVIAAEVTGRDPQFDQPLRGPDAPQQSNFLGVTMSPMMRYRLENIIPITRNINRSNPGFIFGRPAEFDDEGNMVRPPQRSWWGTPRDRRDRAADFRAWWQRLASAGGFNTYSIDVMSSMGWRQAEIRNAIQEGRDYVVDRERDLLSGDYTSQQLTIEYEKLEYARAAVTMLEMEYREVEQWAQERGMSWPAAIRALEQEQTRTHTLNNLPIEQQEAIIDLYYGDQNSWPTIRTTPQPQ